MPVNSPGSSGKTFAVPFTLVPCNLVVDSGPLSRTSHPSRVGLLSGDPGCHHPSSHTENFQETLSAPIPSSREGGSPFAQAPAPTCAVWVIQCWLLLCSRGNAPSLTCRRATARGVRAERAVHAAGLSAGNADVPKPPETGGPAALPKPSPVSAGSEGRAAALAAPGTASPSRVNFRDKTRQSGAGAAVT